MHPSKVFMSPSAIGGPFILINVEDTKRISGTASYGCRDMLHGAWNKQNAIAYRLGDRVDRNKFIQFIQLVEKRIKRNTIENFPPSKFSDTNVRSVIYISISSWWLAESIRRSFLSELIRAAIAYSIDTSSSESKFWGSIWSRPYFQNTKKDVRRFLQGYTHVPFGVKGVTMWSSGMTNHPGCLVKVRSKYNPYVIKNLEA